MATKKRMEKLATCTKAQFLEHFTSNNPVLIRDEKCEASRSAYKRLLFLVGKLDEENLITHEEKDELLKALNEIYSERKAQFYLETRLKSVVFAIEGLIEFAVNKRKTSDTDFYYSSSIRHTIKNG